jgi:hypothetical protein
MLKRDNHIYESWQSFALLWQSIHSYVHIHCRVLLLYIYVECSKRTNKGPPWDHMHFWICASYCCLILFESPWNNWNVAESGVKHNKSNHEYYAPLGVNADIHEISTSFRRFWSSVLINVVFFSYSKSSTLLQCRVGFITDRIRNLLFCRVLPIYHYQFI